MDDSDSEYDIEEAVVLVELNGIIDANFLLQDQTPTKVLGIDTNKPILQIGHYIFSGEYEDTTGTVVVYQPVDSAKTDASESPEKTYEFLCKTDKKLTMKRIFIQEKTNDHMETIEGSSCTTSVVNGDHGISSDISKKISSITEDLIENNRLSEAQPEALNTENGIRNLCSNFLENQLQGDSNSKLVENLTDSSKSTQKKSFKKATSKGDNLDNSRSVESLNSKSKGQKKRRGSSKSRKRRHDPVESETKDIDPVSIDISKHMKVQVDESHMHDKVEIDMQEKHELVPSHSIENSLKDTSTQENVIESMEEISVLNESSSGHTQGTISITQVNNQALENSIMGNNVSASVNENVDIGIQVETIYSDNNEAISISNPDIVNQLVESSTDKLLVSGVCSSMDQIRGDGNCSSSGDMVRPENNISLSSDICQSSDSKSVPVSLQEPIERVDDNGASSSTCHNNNKSSLGQEDEMEEGIVIKDSSYSELVQIDTQKPASCEVSQSLDDETQASLKYSEVKDSNECETSVSPLTLTDISSNMGNNSNVGEGTINKGEDTSNAVDITVSSESQQFVAEGVTPIKRKLSSCEVTQSNSSEREFPETRGEVSECEVFSQNPLSDVKLPNSSANEMIDPFGLAAGSSDEVIYSRHSLASESSTSEVSQSHRSVIQESKSVEERDLEDLPSVDGAVCSQSSDQLYEHLNKISMENKDLCVSSCDVSKDLSDDESVGASEDLNTGCEVSQSDKLDTNTSSENVEVFEVEGQLSNECETSNCILEETVISPSINQSGGITSHTTIEVSDTGIISGRQMPCEVTQSFSSDNKASVSGINLHMEPKQGSSECDNYEDSCLSTGVLNDDSNNNCVSSDDISHFPAPLQSENEIEDQELTCEVSQSFRSRDKILSPEEPCGSSDLRNDYVQRNSDVNEPELKNSCEVTQSLELESSSVSELYEDEDDSINECAMSDLNSDAIEYPDDHVEEICESSDDIIVVSNDESDSQSEQVQPINYSVCEVSQSYRLEDGVLIPLTEQSFDIEVESSNECEVYAPSVSSAVEYITNQSDPDEKNICESSDDIERSSLDIKYSHQSESDSHEVCQSTKCEENPSSDVTRVGFQESNSSEYEVGNEANNFADDINVCESSEDINVDDQSSPEPNANACTSSDKRFKKPIDKTDQIIGNNYCDSFSSQAIAGPSIDVSIDEMESNQISQSENETTAHQVSSNSSQSDKVKVSSSVDSISGNYVDVIYSSSNVSNSTISSNSEVSQSSARRGPYVWSGNLLSAASSSNSRVIIADNASSEEQLASVTGEANVQSSVNITFNDPIVITETSDTVPHSDCPMPSSHNNDALVESPISSSSVSEKRIKKHILMMKKAYEGSSKNLDCTSQNSKAIKEQKRESVILGGSSSSKSDFLDNLGLHNQPEVESMPQQLPLQQDIVSQFERRNAGSDPRQSLLEVMVSSASDFRNSLLYDSTSFSMETNNASSVVESSSSNIRSPNEFPESFISEATEYSSEANENVTPAAYVPQSFSVENSDSVSIEVTGSIEDGMKYKFSSGSTSSQHQVSQSSDIVNTHSSTSQTQTLVSDGISESFRPDLVQSSSSVSKTCIATKGTPIQEISHASENIMLPKSSKTIVAPESSSADISIPTYSRNNTVSSENSVQLIESSGDLPSSILQSENRDSEVSSTPFNIHHTNREVLSTDGSEQCSVIEGNLVLLPESNKILNISEEDITEAGEISANSDFVTLQSNGELNVQASNEADTLNHGSISSPTTPIPTQENICRSTAIASVTNTCELVTEGNVSTTPVYEVEVMAEVGDESSEVSESVVNEQNELSRSALDDNNVSCSIVEFSLHNETFDKKYSFNEGQFSGASREAESKSDDDGISSYHSICDDNIIPVQNLPSSANTELSMYSHIGEFDDSIQSSSLDATHLSINEQIKAISSPPTFSNSESSEEQVPMSINSFVSFSSESHNLPSIQYDIPSINKISPFITDEITSRLHTEGISDCKSTVIGSRETGIARSTVVQSPNTTSTQGHTSTIDGEVSESESLQLTPELDESSRISALTDNSPQEYEVLSEYEEIESDREDSNVVDSSNDYMQS